MNTNNLLNSFLGLGSKDDFLSNEEKIPTLDSVLPAVEIPKEQEMTTGPVAQVPEPMIQQVPSEAVQEEAVVEPAAPALDVGDIWDHVLQAEGGYVNHPDDPGGETNFGISKRSFPNEDIRNMTKDRAQEIFVEQYFDKVNGEELLEKNPGVAAHVSDMAFNAGPGTAVRLLYDAVDLPRQTKVTAELLDAMDDSEDLVKDYSKARLKYYSSLRNAPTFIKGWTNRVNNLNKALDMKSGLDGAYKQAKDLDVEELTRNVSGAQRDLAKKFSEVDKEERKRLDARQEVLSPLYKKPDPLKKDQSGNLSSIGEVFKATYDAKYYTNTIDGINELTARSAIEASEANRKALGDKFDRSLVEKLTFGLYGGVNNLSDWQEEVDKFKKDNPEVKLPFDKASQVYELAQKKATEIEAKYDRLDSGSFSDGFSAALSKMGHVLGGYLPGEIFGALSDRTEGALNLAPLPGLTSVRAAAKGAAAVGIGTGAAQFVVQPKRSEIGLDSGFQRGAVEAASAGLGQFALGSIAALASKLFRAGSKQAAEQGVKQADLFDSILKNSEVNPNNLHIREALKDMKIRSEEMGNNPYGTNYEAKMQYEHNEKAAMQDLLNDRAVRDFADSPGISTDTTKSLSEQFGKMYSDTEIPGPPKSLREEGAQLWNKFKSERMQSPKDLQSTVPYEGPEGTMYKFRNLDEANAFIDSKGLRSSSVVAKTDPSGEGAYLARPSELEWADEVSSRLTQEFKEGKVGNRRIRGYAENNDLEVALKYPDYVTAREVKAPRTTPESSFDIESTRPHHAYLRRLEQRLQTKMSEVDAALEADLNNLRAIRPDYKLDLGEAEGELITVDSLLKDVDDEKIGLQEMFNCMVKPSAIKGE